MTFGSFRRFSFEIKLRLEGYMIKREKHLKQYQQVLTRNQLNFWNSFDADMRKVVEVLSELQTKLKQRFN